MVAGQYEEMETVLHRWILGHSFIYSANSNKSSKEYWEIVHNKLNGPYDITDTRRDLSKEALLVQAADELLENLVILQTHRSISHYRKLTRQFFIQDGFLEAKISKHPIIKQKAIIFESQKPKLKFPYFQENGSTVQFISIVRSLLLLK